MRLFLLKKYFLLKIDLIKRENISIVTQVCYSFLLPFYIVIFLDPLSKRFLNILSKALLSTMVFHVFLQFFTSFFSKKKTQST